MVIDVDKMSLAGEIEVGFGTNSIDTIFGAPTLVALDHFHQIVAVVDLNARSVTRSVDVSVRSAHEFTIAKTLAASADGAFLLIGTGRTGFGSVVTVLDSQSFSTVYGFGGVFEPLAIATNDGMRVYASNLDATITVFDLTSQNFASIAARATDLNLSRDGGTLLSVSSPLGPVALIDTDTETDEPPRILDGLDYAYEAEFSRDESQVFIAAGDEGIVVFDSESLIENDAIDVGATVTHLVAIPDSDLVAASSLSEELFVVNMRDGVVHRFDSTIGVASDIAISEVDRGCGIECVGDCDGDGQVVVSELILGVNLALGTAPSDKSCDTLDRDDSENIAIGEVLEAVINALRGCPAVVGFG